MEPLLLIPLIVLLFLYIKEKKSHQTNIKLAKLREEELKSIQELAIKEAESKNKILNAENDDLKSNIEKLSKYQSIADIDEEIKKKITESQAIIDRNKTHAQNIENSAKSAAESTIQNANIKATELRNKANALLNSARTESETIANSAKENAEQILKTARTNAAELRNKADQALNAANNQAAEITLRAQNNATSIAGDAYTALERSKEIQATVTAMENVIKGYGIKYLKPTQSLLDDLADGFSHTDAGLQLTAARKNSKLLTETGKAALCDYVEVNRSQTAIAFVTDAFNGKVDSILATIKAENIGKLEQQIHDAYSLVNHLGKAFRDARITPAYLESRLQELKLAATVVALRDQEREEQRQIKEQIREEEKARREYERAIKDAAKEEENIRKAMEKTAAQIAKATDEQRTEFELKLAELQEKLTEAEAKNQRALSMAQQTRAGHVYVISNIGSFGETVFKIGMTRRLEPMDRVKELGDASVPFTFDVHAMMYSDDAPGLERELHRRFNLQRMNMVNFRKEFFCVDLQQIKSSITELTGGDLLKEAPHFTLTAAAHEYRETQAIKHMNQEERNQHLARLLKLETLTPLEELSEEIE
ncbi:DUF4041 domain-containing protein [Deefgea piscis]|uniref:DUF4041 domain-containing protein n=1 Tax=Deefgea piscis TaxID=2739061 RepID=A0A6M8SQC4_9NEIS|nr:DUF4041 domain-containing protein [Deefgea piscis]QKJ67462.1 DUF4041 domain-containing protein [Deefgea piscis]